MERKTLDSCGRKRKDLDLEGKAEVGFFTLVKITFLYLPAESKCLKRNGTDLLCLTQLKNNKVYENSLNLIHEGEVVWKPSRNFNKSFI
jgi:hypothetical protein